MDTAARGAGQREDAEMRCKLCGYEVVQDARYPNGVRHAERHATLPHDAIQSVETFRIAGHSLVPSFE